ncbi:hypothetical protein MAUB1S_00447 [Mycolicibacterium aubagnense]
MANENRPKPNAWQYIKYSYGGRLPDSMRAWVTEDLVGAGATLRIIVRMFIPAFLILIPIWFLPELLGIHGSSDLVIRLSATVPILIPVIYFSHALNKNLAPAHAGQTRHRPETARSGAAPEERPHPRGLRGAVRPAER